MDQLDQAMMPGVPSIDTKFPLPSVTLPNGTDENGTAITYTVTHPTYLFFDSIA